MYYEYHCDYLEDEINMGKNIGGKYGEIEENYDEFEIVSSKKKKENIKRDEISLCSEEEESINIEEKIFPENKMLILTNTGIKTLSEDEIDNYLLKDKKYKNEKKWAYHSPINSGKLSRRKLTFTSLGKSCIKPKINFEDNFPSETKIPNDSSEIIIPNNTKEYTGDEYSINNSNKNISSSNIIEISEIKLPSSLYSPNLNRCKEYLIPKIQICGNQDKVLDTLESFLRENIKANIITISIK